MRCGFVLVLVPTCCFVAGCDTTGPEDTEDVFSWSLEFATLPYPGWSVLLTGDTARATATAHDQTGRIITGVVPEWYSEDPAILSVDSTGLVTARGPGFGQVGVRQCGCSMGVNVVARPEIAAVELQPDTLVLVPGNLGISGYLILDASGDQIPDDPTLGSGFWGALLRWRSTNPGIAAVDSIVMGSGFAGIQAVEQGTAAIVASVFGIADSLMVTVARVDLDRPAPGWSHVCARSSDSAAYCWGDAIQYAVGWTWGPGYRSGRGPVALTGGLQFVTMASGGVNTCGLTATGALYCWGDNTMGQLGIGRVEFAGGPQAVSPGVAYQEVSVGYGHTCALAAAGAVSCWGSNDAGQLGAESTGETCSLYTPKAESVNVPCSRAPRPLDGGLAFARIRAGAGLTCGLSAEGALYCWGGGYGSEPVQVGDGVWTDIALGGVVTEPFGCGLDPDGNASCWGRASGGLGDGATTESWTPVAVAGDNTFTAVSVGSGACGLTAVGDVYCWGGTGSMPLGAQTPQRVSGSLTFTSVAAGGGFACGRATDGDVWCWGANYQGQLGLPGSWAIGGTDYAMTPVKVWGQK